MESLKELYEKGEYENLLKSSENLTDEESILLRISALLALSRAKEGLEVLLKNREALFRYRPALTMKTNFEIRFALGQFDEAREDLEYYKNAPYVSQSIEEALASYPQIIREEEKAYLLKGYARIDDYEASLSSKDPFVVLSALNKLGKAGIKGHEEGIKKVLISKDTHPDVRTFALQLLSYWNYPEEVEFLSEEGKIKLIPKDIPDPFSRDEVKWLKEEFSSLQDTSLGKVCANLLDQLCLVCYPSCPLEKEKEVEFDAFLSLGEDYLGYSGKSLTKEALEEKQRISAILDKHPPLN